MNFDETRLYTVVNADKVKIGSKGYFADTLTALKQKIADNLPLEELTQTFSEEVSARFSSRTSMAFFLFYLVEKPKEKKYRPYKDTSEITGHALFDEVIDTDDVRCAIIAISKTGVCIATHGWVDMEHLYNFFKWSDSSPCGIKE